MLGNLFIRVFILSCLLLLAYSDIMAADPAASLQTQKDRESYSMGYKIGLSVKTDGADIDVEKLIQGMRTAIDGKEPLLSPDEMKKLLVKIKKRARDEALRKYQIQIVDNAEKSEEFLAENGKKEGVRTTESGLQYRILKEGEGMSPSEKDFVKVHYRGRLTDDRGREFDSSYSKGAPQTVQVDGVIKGWTEALKMMKVGSKWEIYVPPHLAYGRAGLGVKIPPNSVLIFEIELLSIDKETETKDKKS